MSCDVCGVRGEARGVAEKEDGGVGAALATASGEDEGVVGRREEREEIQRSVDVNNGRSARLKQSE